MFRHIKNSICFLIICAGTLFSRQPPFTWINDHGLGRQEHVYFKRVFGIESAVKKAELHLFADSRYLLKINGYSVGTGPVRFYPERAYFDTYNIKQWLHKGENVIAVHVLSHGMNTFQTPMSLGAFTAWGEIVMDHASIDLNVARGWLCRRSNAYHEDSPKMDFALGAMEVVDTRKGPNNWFDTRIDDAAWKKPIRITNQAHWNSLQPRQIPFLTQKGSQPLQLLGWHEFDDSEDFISFRIKTPDQLRSESAISYPAMAETDIYSPAERETRFGLWYGDYYINGEKLDDFRTAGDKAQCRYYPVRLQKGWNYFLAKGRTSLGSWEFYLNYLKSDSLLFSPSRKFSDDVIIKIALLSPEEMELAGNYPAQSGANTSMKWQDIRRENGAGNAAWEIAWQRLRAAKAQNLAFNPLEFDQGKGQALIYDFGGKKLGRVVLKIKARSGTKIDLGYSEDLFDGRAFVLKRPGLYIGTRFIANGTLQELETLHPYGFKYLQVNIWGADGLVELKELKVISETYPFKKTGSFECSDPLLTRIWEMGWRTLQVCSEDSYIDTPFRERGTYAGDALPEYAATLATTNDSRLMKQTLLTLRGLNRHIFRPGFEPHKDGMFGNLEDYPHLMIQALNWYYLRTGDFELVQDFYPEFKFFLNNTLALRDESGFYTNPTRAFIEWSTIEKHDAELTAIHVFMAESCRILSEWANLLDLNNDAEYFDKSRNELAELIREYFWDEDLGTFHDGYKNGSKLGTAFPISGALAAIYNIATENQEEKVVKYIVAEIEDIGSESRKQKASTYGSFYLLQALFNNQQSYAAERFFRKHWGPMVLKHDDTAWENFDDMGIGTLSHAWSAHPTYFLTTEVLGVPMEFKSRSALEDTIVISPQSATLDWAKGEVTLPKGQIKVSWQISGENLLVKIDAPEGLEYQVRPRGRLAAYNLILN